MKNTFITFALFLSLTAFSQSITFKEMHENTLILLAKELDGKVEFDGHIFENKKSKDPIRFEATLEGIKIFDSKKEYTYTKCKKEKCEITHLEEASYYLNIKGNNLLYHTNYERNTNGL